MAVKEPGLDQRHADHAPKTNQIRQKNANALNGNLPNPIPQFRPDATVGTMREVTGQNGLKGIARVAREIRPDKGKK